MATRELDSAEHAGTPEIEAIAPADELRPQRMATARSVLAWSLLAVALFLALAFVTFDPFLEEAGRAANLVGPPGAFLASLLVNPFGIGAFALPFFLVFLSWRLLSGREVGEVSLKLLGLFVGMASFGALAETLLPGRAFPSGSGPLGGVLGFRMAEDLGRLIGPGWSVIVFGMGVGCAVVLIFDRLVLHAVRQREVARAPRHAVAQVDPDPELQARRREMARELEATASQLPHDEQRMAAAESYLLRTDPEYEPGELELGPVKLLDRDADAEAGVRPLDRAAEESAAATLEEPAEAAEEAWEDEPEGEEYEEDEEEYEEDGEAEDEEAWEDEGEEDPEAEEEWEYEDEGEEEEGEEDEEVEEVQGELEEEPEPVRPAPKITTSTYAQKAGDGIQVIRLSRDPKIKGKEKYALPPLTVLAEPKYIRQRESDASVQTKGRALEEALADFGVSAEVTEIERGPVITRFDLVLARGTKISKVTGLADDLAMAMGAAGIRIAPVKGKSVLGVEIPNQARETVYLKDVATSLDLRKKKVAIPLFLGKDASGAPIVEDLASTPHLLIAGRTGAGKSVFVNSLVLSILLTRYPEEVRLIMIDPKKVELEVYQEIPHLLTKVESDPKRATKILEWAVNQMEERYELLAATGVRHLTSYNKLSKKERTERLSKLYSPEEIEKLPAHLPYIVIIVDELADLMMVSGKEVEQAIARLAQKARAVGLHVVLATQRPSTDVITGLIKSNLPARIAFQTRTGIDSRTIIDRYGAEKLLDRGDMLYLSATSDHPRRIQGPFVSDEEVDATVDYLRKQASPYYTHHLEQVSSGGTNGFDPSGVDALFEQAVEVVMTTGQASASFLQRRMSVGYARASRLVDLMSEAGIVSEHRGSKVREILISPDQWNEMRQQLAGASSS